MTEFGKLLGIYTASDKGLPMQAVDSIQAIANQGLAGDRYAEGRGAFSKPRDPKIRHVSLIAQEVITTVRMFHDDYYTPIETRRNLLTEDVALNDLVGAEFMIGSVVMRGTSLCNPCERPGKLLNKPGFTTAFAGVGGLRAEILSSGILHTGDTIEY